MQDNGLLKYYFEHRDGRGFLKTGEIDGHQYSGQGDEQFCSYLKLPQTKRLYIKPCTKEIADAEILLSQVYSKVGIKTAIYTPAIDKFKKEVLLSNDIENPNTLPAFSLFSKIRNQNPEISHPDFIPSKLDKSGLIERYFTPKGFKSGILMTALDVGAGNRDRNITNYFFGQNGEGVCDDVWSIDYGNSGLTFDEMRGCPSMTLDELQFYSRFEGEPGLYRGEMIRNLRENPNVNALFGKNELAKTIGSVDVSKTAKDIKETIGYEVDPMYVYYLDKSFDILAEDLTQ